MSDITHDEWLAELERCGAFSGDEGATVTEIAASTGRSDKWVRNRLRTGLADGSVAMGRAPRERLDGLTARVPVYRLVSKGKKGGGDAGGA